MSTSTPSNTAPGIFFTLPDLGLPTSTAAFLQIWLNQMQAAYPGFSPSAADLDYIMAQVIASWAASLAQLCSAGATDLFRNFGTQLLNLPYEQGTPAQAIVLIATAAPASIATTSSALSIAAPITQIPVDALLYAVAAGTIQITSDINSQTFATTGAAAGSTAIPISSITPNYSYPSGSPITGLAQYTLPAQTTLTLTLNGAQVGFQTDLMLVINSGSSAQTIVSAIATGTTFNGSGAPAQMLSQIDWITGVTVVSNASGGVDQEDDDQYVQRLAQILQLLTPRPITASDYSIMALNFIPASGTDQQQVGRATSIDGYDPNYLSDGNPEFGNERMVGVCITDTFGNALNADTILAVQTYLEALREINFLVNVVSPNYTTIYAAVSVFPTTGYSASTVQSNVQTALLNYLSPQNFGLPIGAISGWNNQTTIYISRVAAVIQQVAGVDHMPYGTLTVDFNTNPTNTGDLILPGAFPLPLSSPTSIPLSNITVLPIS